MLEQHFQVKHAKYLSRFINTTVYRLQIYLHSNKHPQVQRCHKMQNVKDHKDKQSHQPAYPLWQHI